MTDLRLVAPALCAWAASITVLLGLSSIEVLETRNALANRLMVLILVVSAVSILVLRRRHGLVVTIGAVALSALAAGAQVSAWSTPALTPFLGSQVQMSGVVNGPPRESLGVVYVPVTSHSFTRENTESVGIHIPVSVTLARFSPIPDPGTSVLVSGLVRPAGGSVTTAVYLRSTQPMAIIDQPGVIDRAAQRVRDALHASLPMKPAGGSALVAGLAIGDETTMSPILVEQMRMSGLSHLTAVSGGNVAIVIGSVIALAWLLRLPMVGRIIAALVCLVFYVIVVHPEPSVLRAGVMGAVVVLSLLVGGRRPGPSVLATAVLVLVVVAPSLSVSWGFALSVAATAGIVMLAPVLRQRIDDTSWGTRIPAPVTIAVTLTMAAQIATAPVLLAMGAYVGVAAVPANVLAMPMVPIVTIAGLVAALVGLIPGMQPVAEFVAWIGAWAGEWIAQVAVHASGVDVLRIRGSPLVASVFVVVIVVLIFVWRRASNPVRVGVVLIALVGLTLSVIAPPARRAWPPAGWVAVQCDVGQGDGFVIAPTQGSGAVVIDTGVSARVMDRCLEDLGVHHIAALVLTHFHADHVNGLAGVIDGRQVDAVLSTIAEEPPEQAEGVRHELDRRGLQLTQIRAGTQFRVGDGAYRVIWPRRIITSGRISEGSVANNASIVMDVRLRGVRMLLTGDIEPPAQAALLANPGDFDVVKVPHHGSVHQHPRFASWADAELALVSVGGDNSFGHPAPKTLEQWQAVGATVVRTDLLGDIAVVLDADGRLGWVGRASR